jgi:hypothetical protein
LLLAAGSYFVLTIADPKNVITMVLFLIIIGSALIFLVSSETFINMASAGVEHRRHFAYHIHFFAGCGGTAAFFIIYGLQSILIPAPANLVILFLFLAFALLLVLNKMKEPLPSKEERGWKNAMQFLYVLKKESGIPLYSFNLTNLSGQLVNTPNEDLLGGALVAVSSLLKEIVKNDNPLKTIQQVGYSITLEEGKWVVVAIFTLKDLKVIREKARKFLVEFESRFGELLAQDYAETTIFSPASMLVEKYFQ